MAVQGNGVVLGEDGDFFNAGINTIAHRNVNQAIATRQWHRWLGTLPRQRIQPRAAPTTQNKSQNIIHTHSRSPLCPMCPENNNLRVL